jgi:hypothetical protein
MFCSFLGELVANPEDRLFVLTRPVKRTTYFTVKLLLAVIACCLLASLNSICVHFANEHFKADPQFVSVSLVEDTKQALTSFMIAIFGGVVGCSFRYYARPMIPTVFVMVFTLSYAVSFAFLKGTTSNETNMSDLEFFTMPLALMLPLSVVVINIGYLLNSKVNIGV